MRRILGTIDHCNPSKEVVKIEYDESMQVYIISSNQNKQMILSKEEMKKLYKTLDDIDKYR